LSTQLLHPALKFESQKLADGADRELHDNIDAVADMNMILSQEVV